MLKKAMLLAENHFKGKRDIAGKPYIEHLIAVSEQMETEEDKVVALLHDIIEDTDISFKELNETIPFVLIARILLLTHDKRNDSYDLYIDNIVNSGDINAIKIKMADLWHNMDLNRLQKIDSNDLARFLKYRKSYKKLENKYIQTIKFINQTKETMQDKNIIKMKPIELRIKNITEVKQKLFKVDVDVLKKWEQFVKNNKQYKVQNLISLALEEFIER